MNGKPDASPKAFPWPDVIAFGLGVLRLAPAHFWSMTLPELAAAMRGASGIDPKAQIFDHEALSTLMALYPDDGGPAHG